MHNKICWMLNKEILESFSSHKIKNTMQIPLQAVGVSQERSVHKEALLCH